MNQSILINETMIFMMIAHHGQKYGDLPYWTHPYDVAVFGQTFFGEKFGEIAIIVALLHDVIEDTDNNRRSLSRLGYSNDILDAVELVTKVEGLSYSQNIQRIIDSGNETAMMVKFADNYINFTGDKSGWAEWRIKKSQTKYFKSMESLAKNLGVTIPDEVKL